MALAIVPAWAACSPAIAQVGQAATFDIPAMPLVAAIGRLSALTGISVGGILRVPSGVRSRAVRGPMSVAAALDQMLEGTGLRAVRLDARTYRIVAARRPVLEGAIRRRTPVAPVPPPSGDIVVVAAKLPGAISRRNGNVEVVSLDEPVGLVDQRGSASDLTAQLPSLSATRLGRGRDKLFLRGIADSSFVGPSQATLGQYLGEARVNYNGPDPGLLLYDIDRLELLKGPQGALYGAGTLGGVLRIEPRRADPSVSGGFVDAAISATAQGTMGHAIAAAVNMPVVEGAGVRLLGYRRLEGGYIDNLGRGLRDVNRTTVEGGRAQLHLDT
ncbi:MAG: TonB-dependent receptor, partial [Sphingomonas sp.]